MTSDDDLLAHATVHPEPSGRCASGAPARWVFTDEGVARLDLFARTLALDPPRSPTGFSIRGHHYALVEEEMVWVRSPDVMHRYRIEGAAPRATALADDALWVVTD